MAYKLCVTARSVSSAMMAAALALALTSSVQAVSFSSTARALFTAENDKAEPPPGWAEFCIQYVTECRSQPGQAATTPRIIAVTPEVWETIVDVNKWANEHIRPLSDEERRGRENVWSYGENGRGDCKDYVLVKQRKLIELGLPRESLLITIVWTPQKRGHAVLIARTDQGDLVLDSLSSEIVLWSETPYTYVERQSQADPNTWSYIDGPPPTGGDVWIAHGLI